MIDKKVREKSRDELMDELFQDLHDKTNEQIVNELRVAVPGSLSVAMDPMYIKEKMFDHVFSLEIKAKSATRIQSFSWIDFSANNFHLFACNDSQYGKLQLDDNFMMAA